MIEIDKNFTELYQLVESIIVERRGKPRDEEHTFIIDLLIESQDQDDNGIFS